MHVPRNCEPEEHPHDHRNSTPNSLQTHLLHRLSANGISDRSGGSRRDCETGCEESRNDDCDEGCETDVWEIETSHAASHQYWHNSSMPSEPERLYGYWSAEIIMGYDGGRKFRVREKGIPG